LQFGHTKGNHPDCFFMAKLGLAGYLLYLAFWFGGTLLAIVAMKELKALGLVPESPSTGFSAD